MKRNSRDMRDELALLIRLAIPSDQQTAGVRLYMTANEVVGFVLDPGVATGHLTRPDKTRISIRFPAPE